MSSPSAGGRVELPAHLDELLEVLDPALGLDRALGLERLDVAASGENGLHELADRDRLRGLLGGAAAVRRKPAEAAQLVHRVHEAAERLHRGGAEARDLLGLARHLPHGQAERGGVRRDAGERRRADPTAGRVGYAREADDVERVGQQRQVGDRVLDLGALVELRPADHLVGDLVADERVLEHARHGVRAVQDGDLGARGALVEQPLDLSDDEARLGVLVLERAQLDRIALTEFAPEALGDAAAVVGDHRVGRLQDRLGGAVVLLELDHARVFEVVLEVEDVADVGAAEAVDRLLVVADDREVAMAGRPRVGRSIARSCARWGARPPPTSSWSRRYWAWLVSWYSSTSTWRKDVP